VKEINSLGQGGPTGPHVAAEFLRLASYLSSLLIIAGVLQWEILIRTSITSVNNNIRAVASGQGRINHLANRANARGLTLSGASCLNIKTLLFLVFHVFRLLNVRQNCRAFWWLRLVYKLRKLTTLAFIDFEWLKRIEPNSITLYGLPFNDFK